MAKKKICLDAGHYGKYNQSTVIPEYYESDMTWKLHNYLKTELIARGFSVIVTRTSQAVDLDLYQRGKKSKGCDLFLSIHSNASSNANADTAMACCMINDTTTMIDDVSVSLGRQLADAVTSAMTGKSKGKVYRRVGASKKDYYGVLRGAKDVGVPGILMEHGYHTNLANTQFLMKDANLKKLAKVEADIIAKYFGVGTTTTTTTTAPTTSTSKVTTLPATPFTVKVIDDALNIRSGAGTLNKVVGVIKDKKTYTIIETKKVGTTNWGKLKSGAGWICISDNYVEIGKTVADTSTTTTGYPKCPFKVKVIDDALNIRSGAGTLNKVVGVIKDKKTYTIIETKKVGTTNWGKLKSGAGWICINAKYVKVV